TIVLARDASPSERHGARELQRFLHEISGAQLPIASEEARPRGPWILVGRSRLVERLGVRADWNALGPEGFLVKTAGRNLVIAGGRQRGTMYGVYVFLEKLGCRWFTPEVSRIPKSPTIRIPPLDETHKPSFEYREPFFTEAFDRDWAARNRMNGHSLKLDESTGGKIQYYPFVHSFYLLLPPEKYFREHPEYYSLIAGKRRAERGQLCLTNPEVLRLATEQVLRWIEEHPEATIFSVSQNDWTGWCECDNCRRVEEEEGGAHSGPLLRFVNALAAEIERKHPGKLIDTLAYWYTEEPPAHVRPRANVRIRLCPIGACQAHPYERCDRNAYFMRRLRAWAKITDKLYVWHYNTNFAHYLMPFPDFDELVADIPMYHRHGVVGLFMQGAYAPGGGGEMAELRSYLMARLLWDVKADARKAIEEFLEAVYGRAAPRIAEYLELLHRQVRFPPEGRGHHLWIFQHPGAPYLEAEFLKRARELLERAEREAENELVRRRVRKVRLSLDYVELVRAMAFEFQDGWFAMPRAEQMRRRFADFLATARSFGIRQLHEGRGLEFDEKEFERRLRRYGVVTLENPFLRAWILPELDARVISLVHKPSQQELLMKPDPGEAGYPNVLGLSVQPYPDYQGRPWEGAFRIVSAAPDRVHLVADLANGLRVSQTQRLRGAELLIETVLENVGDRAIQAALQARANYGPGRLEDPRLAVSYRARDGRPVDRTMFEPGLETSGGEYLDGGACPDGAWRALHRAGGPALVNRFRNDEVARARLEWSVRGDNRLTLGLWTPERTLQPGETLRLEASYAVE
ncbi:MAG: DUF4838 domain-containing protein, partial [Bryobacterales bacterium]|nr:DUF4838 domain-containing protein [Bryobacteraceae bacterium]MDW8131561.1 DUF4838 domain-containing protein [Bryobacterales bacterium]